MPEDKLWLQGIFCPQKSRLRAVFFVGMASFSADGVADLISLLTGR